MLLQRLSFLIILSGCFGCTGHASGPDSMLGPTDASVSIVKLGYDCPAGLVIDELDTHVTELTLDLPDPVGGMFSAFVASESVVVRFQLQRMTGNTWDTVISGHETIAHYGELGTWRWLASREQGAGTVTICAQSPVTFVTSELENEPNDNHARGSWSLVGTPTNGE